MDTDTKQKEADAIVATHKELVEAYCQEILSREFWIEHGKKMASTFQHLYQERCTEWANVLIDDHSPENLMDGFGENKKWWIQSMDQLYQNSAKENIYEYWCLIHSELQKLKTIRDQNLCYHKMTKFLNPGQLLECDFYRAIHTFWTNDFEIVTIDEKTGTYCARQSCQVTDYTFRFVIRKKNWITEVFFHDDNDCKTGILRAHLMVDIDSGKHYHGEDFYTCNSDLDNTNRMLEMFEVGYDAMIQRHFALYLELDIELEKNVKIINRPKIYDSKCCYFESSFPCYDASVPKNPTLYEQIYLDKKKVVISQKKHFFPRFEHEGMQKSGSQYYYVVNFETSSDIARVISAIKAFANAIATTTTQNEHVLDPFKVLVRQLDDNDDLEITERPEWSDLLNGSVGYDIIIENFSKDKYKLTISVKYFGKEDHGIIIIKKYTRNTDPSEIWQFEPDRVDTFAGTLGELVEFVRKMFN